MATPPRGLFESVGGDFSIKTKLSGHLILILKWVSDITRMSVFCITLFVVADMNLFFTPFRFQKQSLSKIVTRETEFRLKKDCCQLLARPL